MPQFKLYFSEKGTLPNQPTPFIICSLLLRQLWYIYLIDLFMSSLRYSLFLLVFQPFTPKVNAQNLIPNPSFDLVDTCNPTANWIWNLSSWENLGFYDGIAYGTPDPYNICNAPNTPLGIPDTWLTFQY